jgi:glycosyltransferase involved in cell wall biosynthesis
VVVLNVFPLADRPPEPVAPAGPAFRLYWFSQTIGPDRGLEDVVAAMGRLPGLPVELHVRGSWQRGYAAALGEVARAAGVAWSRIISHDPAPPSEMVRCAAGHHVGLALENGRTVNSDILLSNKVFTYLLAGVPVLASATTAQSGLAAALGSAAAAIPIGDVEALSGAIRRWAEQPAALSAARLAAWSLGQDRYNWDAEQQTFLGVVQAVLGERSAPAAAFDGMAS